MKVTLEFDTDKDLDEWNITKRASEYYLTLEDIRNEIRTTLKYTENLGDEAEMILKNLQLILPESG